MNFIVEFLSKLLNPAKFIELVQDFDDNLRELNAYLADRRDRLNVTDEPLSFMASVYGDDRYYDVVAAWTKVDKEYSRITGKQMLIVALASLIPATLIGLVAKLITKQWIVWLIAVVAVVFGIAGMYFTEKALGKLRRPSELKNSIYKALVLNFGDVSGYESIKNATSKDRSGADKESVSKKFAKKESDDTFKMVIAEDANPFTKDGFIKGFKKSMDSAVAGVYQLAELRVLWSSALKLNEHKYAAEFLKRARIAPMSTMFDIDHAIKYKFNDGTGAKALAIKAKHKEVEEKDGKKTIKVVTDFDGRMMIIPINLSGILDRNDTLLITAEDSNLSYMLEDTVRNIYQSKREHVFSLEELNQNLDCKFLMEESDPDAIQLMRERIITPVFEETIQFILHRYGRFNLALTNYGMTFAFSNKASVLGDDSLQKELLGKVVGAAASIDRRNNNAKTRVSMYELLPTGEFGDKFAEFQYWSIFPMIETAYILRALAQHIQFFVDRDTNYGECNEEQLQKLDDCFQSLSFYRETISDLIELPFKEFKHNISDEFGVMKEKMAERDVK